MDTRRCLRTLVDDTGPSNIVSCACHVILDSSPFTLKADAQVEITAKVFHGYNAGEAYKGIDEAELKKTKGRDYDYNHT